MGLSLTGPGSGSGGQSTCCEHSDSNAGSRQPAQLPLPTRPLSLLAKAGLGQEGGQQAGVLRGLIGPLEGDGAPWLGEAWATEGRQAWECPGFSPLCYGALLGSGPQFTGAKQRPAEVQTPPEVAERMREKLGTSLSLWPRFSPGSKDVARCFLLAPPWPPDFQNLLQSLGGTQLPRGSPCSRRHGARRPEFGTCFRPLCPRHANRRRGMIRKEQKRIPWQGAPRCARGSLSPPHATALGAGNSQTHRDPGVLHRTRPDVHSLLDGRTNKQVDETRCTQAPSRRPRHTSSSCGLQSPGLPSHDPLRHFG